MAQEAIFEEIDGVFIGIDLGTTNSVVTYFKDGRFDQIRVRGRKVIPSALYFESPTKVIFGEKALRKGVTNPEFLITEFKRELGSKYKYELVFEEKVQETKKKIFVIDTNIFIDEASILDEFNNKEKIILPKSVLSELSNQAQNNENINEAANIAIDNIERAKDTKNISFEDSDLSVLSQDLVANSRNDDNDNRILSIAKSFTINNPDTEVVLITNDAALRQKADSEDVIATSYSDFQFAHSKVKNDDTKITITPKEATKKLLEHIKEESEKTLKNEDITKAVITVPANFTQSQIELTKEAGKEAGFSEISIQKEPVAAGLAYAVDEEKNKTILIYDFGGGTFDCSLLSIKDGKIEVIDTAGDNKLGGKDITNKITEFIYNKIYDETSDELDMLDFEESGLSKADFNKNVKLITDEAEKAKIDLSDMEKTEIRIPNLIGKDEKTFNIEFELSRDEFDEEIAEIRKRTIDVVINLLNSTGVDKADIDEIILAGGTSSIPSIRTSLKDRLGIDIQTSKDTSVVISQGAAIDAMKRWSDSNLLDEKIIYNDKALKDFGIETRNHNFDVLIPKGTALPVRVTKDYTTEKDNQEFIELNVFQRESINSSSKKTYDEGITLVDTLKIEGIPPRKVNELTIKVTFELTKDDILELEVEIEDINGDIIEATNLNILKASHV